MKNPYPLNSPRHAAWRTGYKAATIWFNTDKEHGGERRWYRVGGGMDAYLEGRAAGAKVWQPRKRVNSSSMWSLKIDSLRVALTIALCVASVDFGGQKVLGSGEPR
jgi:hypothetical protein